MLAQRLIRFDKQPTAVQVCLENCFNVVHGGGHGLDWKAESGPGGPVVRFVFNQEDELRLSSFFNFSKKAPTEVEATITMADIKVKSLTKEMMKSVLSKNEKFFFVKFENDTMTLVNEIEDSGIGQTATRGNVDTVADETEGDVSHVFDKNLPEQVMPHDKSVEKSLQEITDALQSFPLSSHRYQSDSDLRNTGLFGQDRQAEDQFRRDQEQVHITDQLRRDQEQGEIEDRFRREQEQRRDQDRLRETEARLRQAEEMLRQLQSQRYQVTSSSGAADNIGQSNPDPTNQDSDSRIAFNQDVSMKTVLGQQDQFEGFRQRDPSFTVSEDEAASESRLEPVYPDLGLKKPRIQGQTEPVTPGVSNTQYYSSLGTPHGASTPYPTLTRRTAQQSKPVLRIPSTPGLDDRANQFQSRSIERIASGQPQHHQPSMLHEQRDREDSYREKYIDDSKSRQPLTQDQVNASKNQNLHVSFRDDRNHFDDQQASDRKSTRQAFNAEYDRKKYREEERAPREFLESRSDGRASQTFQAEQGRSEGQQDHGDQDLLRNGGYRQQKALSTTTGGRTSLDERDAFLNRSRRARSIAEAKENDSRRFDEPDGVSRKDNQSYDTPRRTPSTNVQEPRSWNDYRRPVVRISTMLPDPDLSAEEILDALEDLRSLNYKDTEIIASFLSSSSEFKEFKRSLSLAQKRDLRLFGEALKERKPLDHEAAETKFNEVRQRPGEDESDVYFRLIRLHNISYRQPQNSRISPMVYNRIKSRFIQALESDEVRKQFRFQDVPFDQMVHQARKWRLADEMTRKDREKVFSANVPPGNPTMGNSPRGNGSSEMMQGRCLKHPSLDHADQDCPRHKICGICNRQGHEESNCWHCQLCGYRHRTLECRANAKSRSQYNKIKNGPYGGAQRVHGVPFNHNGPTQHVHMVAECSESEEDPFTETYPEDMEGEDSAYWNEVMECS